MTKLQKTTITMFSHPVEKAGAKKKITSAILKVLYVILIGKQYNI